MRDKNLRAKVFVAFVFAVLSIANVDGDGESEETLQVRLSNAAGEMNAAADYEYLIINDKADNRIVTTPPKV